MNRNVVGPHLEKLKLEMAKVNFDMEMNDLTESEFSAFKNKTYEKNHSKRKTENRKATNKALQKGILFIIAGVFEIFIAFGLTDVTNGSMIFYGMGLIGVFLIIKGGLELYLYQGLK